MAKTIEWLNPIFSGLHEEGEVEHINGPAIPYLFSTIEMPPCISLSLWGPLISLQDDYKKKAKV